LKVPTAFQSLESGRSVNKMIFKNLNNKVEIDVKIEEDEIPFKGDVYLSVQVESNGFICHNELWIFKEEFDSFVQALIELEEKRKGEAVLTSISPNELELKVHSVTNRGHIAIVGKTGLRVFDQEKSFQHSLEFGFQFDASQLLEVLKELKEMKQNEKYRNQLREW